MGEVLVFLLLLYVAGLFWVFGRPRKRVYYGQTFEEKPPSPELVVQNDDATEETPKELTPGARLGAILFLSIWLIVWTAGCHMALITAVDLSYGEEGYIFLRIWLAVAIPAWFFVAWTLFRLLRGDNVEISFDGDSDGGD
jgi:hypothetical protein